jgi:hypothetical protein
MQVKKDRKKERKNENVLKTVIAYNLPRQLKKMVVLVQTSSFLSFFNRKTLLRFSIWLLTHTTENIVLSLATL